MTSEAKLKHYSLCENIAAVVKDAYAATGFEDEGRSDEVANEVLMILRSDEMIELGAQAAAEYRAPNWPLGARGHEGADAIRKEVRAIVEGVITGKLE